MELEDHLPQSSDLSPYLISFLSDKFHQTEDLPKAPNLVSELQNQCSDLEKNLTDLNRKLEFSVIKYASHSDRVRDVFDDINAKLNDLRSSTCVSESFIDGRERTILGEELPALAKEVARVETVRMYAETTLKLDTLVGDIEDAVSSSMTGNLKKPHSGIRSEDKRLRAIKTLELTEDVLASVTKTRPQWTHLVSAVDHRVDRALAILRPGAIADHRSLLTSFGWPPPLSNLNSTKLNTGSFQVLNPLFSMGGDLKNQYYENFLALCSLQQLQKRRKLRQLEGHNRDIALRQPLWAIEELVNPISLATEAHFSKWVEKPEFIFALVYKITRDYVDSMDELLQPLVDEARLVGYSCREEWVSAMVTSLTTYLAKDIFPIYVRQLAEDGAVSIPYQARGSWLHLVDLMSSFDKRIQALVSQSGVSISMNEDEYSQRISSMSVFCDRPDWLELWAEIELNDTSDKLKSDIENDRNWKMKIQGAFLVSGSEDYRSPAITGAVLQRLSSLIDRCRPLPSISLRARFIRLAGVPILKEFLDCLLQRCQEAEGLTALADDDALIKVINSINAARYCESVLKEWSEDMFFLEMGLAEDELGNGDDQSSSGIGIVESPNNGIFYEEIGKLEEFRVEWAEKISIVVLRGFDARCRDYMKNKRQWQEIGEEDSTVSKSFVGALDYLQRKISKVEGDLNEIDFVVVWRSLATGVDRLVSSGILMSSAKFSSCGVERFRVDLEVLFGVFRAWCLRPEGFFPRVSEGLKLLRIDEDQLKWAADDGLGRLLKKNGIKHLGLTEAEKILRNRFS